MVNSTQQVLYDNPNEVKGDHICLSDVTLEKETQAAFLIQYERGQHWIPKSQIVKYIMNTGPNGDPDIMIVSEWIAKQKGIID